MKTSVTNKTIWNIAYPIIFGNLAQTLIVFIDTAFLGHVGKVELGASMLAGIYYYVFSTLAWGFAVGLQIIVARRLGEGNLKRIGAVFEHGLVVVFFLATMLFLLMHFFTDTLLEHVINSPNIYDAAMEFMKYRHYGIIFVCFNFLFRSLYIGLSNTKIITYTTFLMSIVNITFDYLLIFGNHGFPKMGIGGAAIASVMA
ncbi:MAG: MATE family efflux transporter, partial [Bacteroidales bacterium]